MPKSFGLGIYPIDTMAWVGIIAIKSFETHQITVPEVMKMLDSHIDQSLPTVWCDEVLRVHDHALHDRERSTRWVQQKKA